MSYFKFYCSASASWASEVKQKFQANILTLVDNATNVLVKPRLPLVDPFSELWHMVPGKIFYWDQIRLKRKVSDPDHWSLPLIITSPWHWSLSMILDLDPWLWSFIIILDLDFDPWPWSLTWHSRLVVIVPKEWQFEIPFVVCFFKALNVENPKV